MYRDVIQYLIEWKERKDRSPLIVRGARQAGKTFAIEEFAGSYFENCLAVNLEEKPELKKVFFDNDVNRILTELSILLNVDVQIGKTLFFIDEIQTCPEALQSLRYFKERIPGLHVICAGSLLDHLLNEMKTSMPVGRVEFLQMFPMSFNEFLLALGQEKLVSYIREFDFSAPFSEAVHHQITRYLRYYFFIGGMPAVVKSYTEENKLSDIQRIQSNIITSFQFDFAKYGTRLQQELLRRVMQYCATNPGKKIKYSQIDRDTRSANLRESIEKLAFSRILHRVTHTNSGRVPLTEYANETVYKTIFMDIGLVNRITGIDLSGLDDLVTASEGMLAEQFIGQSLLTLYQPWFDTQLYYWIREEKSANAEVDFLYQHGNTIFPVEVKAGKTGTLKSMQIFLYEKKLQHGIRFNMDLPNLGSFTTGLTVSGRRGELSWKLLSLPLYMVSELDRLVAYLTSGRHRSVLTSRPAG